MNIHTTEKITLKTIETLEEALERLQGCFAGDNLQQYIRSPTKDQMNAVNRMLEKARSIRELRQDSTTWNQGEAERANTYLEETHRSLTKVRGWSKRTSRSVQDLSTPAFEWLEEFLKSKIRAHEEHKTRRLAELSNKTFENWTPEDDAALERLALSNKTDGSGNFETVIDPKMLALYQARVAYLRKEDNVSDSDNNGPNGPKSGVTQVIGTGDAFTTIPVQTAEPVVGGTPANDTGEQSDEEPSPEENPVIMTPAIETIAENLAKLPAKQWGEDNLRTAAKTIGFRDGNNGYAPKPGYESLYEAFVEAYTRIRGYAPLTTEEAARAAELDQREVVDLSPDDILFVMDVISHKQGARGEYTGLLTKALSTERHFERISALLAKESASDWHHEDLRFAQMCCARKGADGQPHPWLETLGPRLEAALKARNEALGSFADERKTPFVDSTNTVEMLTRWLGITNPFDETREPPARDKDPVGFAAYNRWHAFVISEKADPVTMHERLWARHAIQENLVGPATKRALEERLSRADPPNASPVVTATTAGPSLPPTRMGGPPPMRQEFPNLQQATAAVADAKTAFAPTKATTARKPNPVTRWQPIGEPPRNPNPNTEKEVHSDSSPSVRKRTLVSRVRNMSKWQELLVAVMFVGIVFFLLGRRYNPLSSGTPPVESTDGDAATTPTATEDASSPAPVITPPPVPAPPALPPVVRPPAQQQPSPTWPPPGSHPLTPRDVGARNLSSVDWRNVNRFFYHVRCQQPPRLAAGDSYRFNLTNSDCVWIP